MGGSPGVPSLLLGHRVLGAPRDGVFLGPADMVAGILSHSVSLPLYALSLGLRMVNRIE